MALSVWMSVALSVIAFSMLMACSGDAASVFLEPRGAAALLVRARRFNSGWLEELQKGDLRRECVEERCSYEEAREVFEHDETTNEFWKVYNVRDSCQSSPCLNGGSCSSSGSTYFCLCPAHFSGLICEHDNRAVEDTCLKENGGCEHFCDESLGGRSLVLCSCAEGYLLHADGRSCQAKEEFACGTVPILKGAEPKEDTLRIVGGNECPRGECPWQVLLVYKGQGFCGGVIFQPTWILTASHCLENIQVQFLQVVAGEHNTQQEEGSEQRLQVSEIIMHENYTKRDANNDIALLRLATPIIYSPYAIPVCIPTRHLANHYLWAVSLHTVSGWGRRGENGPTSSVLLRLKVPRIRTSQCVKESGVQITKNMFCAGYIDGGQDSCKGDSGGPLVTTYRRTAFLLGLVSWGRGCARPGNYGIYTRVSNYLEWIYSWTATPSTLPPLSTLPPSTLPPSNLPPQTLPPPTLPWSTLSPPTLSPPTLPPPTLPSSTLPSSTLLPPTLPSSTLPPPTLPPPTLPSPTLPPPTLPSSTLSAPTLPPPTLPPPTLPPSSLPANAMENL